jgi:hypothetical protein
MKGIQGRVYLIGMIGDQGKTDGSIDFAITVPDDRAILEAGLSQWRGRLTFKVVRQEPVEPHVDVTPGSTPKPGGDADQLAQLVNG